MSTTILLRPPTTTLRPPSTTVNAPNCITFLSYSRCGRKQTPLLPKRCRIHHSVNPIVQLTQRSVEKFVIFASNEDATETEIEEPEQQVQESEQEVQHFKGSFGRMDKQK